MATITLGKTGRPTNSHRPFLTERPKELFLGSARVILAPARLTRQESLGSLQNSHFATAKPRFLQLHLERVLARQADAVPRAWSNRQSWKALGDQRGSASSPFEMKIRYPLPWGKLFPSPQIRHGRGQGGGHRWRSGANRPNQRMRRGWAPSGLPCAAKNRAAAGYGSPALHFRLEIRTPKILPPPGRR